MADAHTRHSRGVMVVVFLGVVFFALLALLVLKTPSRRQRPTSATAETLTVLPLRIRLRTEPNAKAPVVATATTGEQLEMLEDRGAWVRVKDSDGLTGWAERSNLERTVERERRLARYAAIRKLPPLSGKAMERTTLYAGPGIFYPLVGELPDDAEVRVFTRDHDFYAIDHNGQVAYADVEAIDVSASGSTQLNVETTTPPTATDTTGTTPPATASMPEPEPPPLPEPTPEPEPVIPSASTGVYAVVPAGGTQPEEIDRVVPRYPTMARRAGVGGSVVIRGIVRRDGTIDDVEIIKNLGYGLGEAARDAVRQWRFRPATYRGEPIDVYYTVTVNFRLQ